MEHIQLVISKDCPEKYIEIIKDYWEYEVTPFDFINKPKKIRDKYNIAQQDLNKIIKPYSKLTFYFHCTSCNSYEFQEVHSQSACVQKLREIKPSKFEEFKCKHCENQMKIEKLKQKEEDRKRMIARLEKAVDEQRWEKLKDFEYKLLDHCISKDLTELKLFYGAKLGKDQIKRLFRGLYILEEFELLVLKTDRYSKTIRGYEVHEKLRENFKYIPRPYKNSIDEEPEIDFDQLDALKFLLPVNRTKFRPDDPRYAGRTKFPKRIIIEPNVEYSFALWERSNGSLYLTLLPTDDIYPSPKVSPL